MSGNLAHAQTVDTRSFSPIFRMGLGMRLSDTDTVDTPSDPPFLGSAHIFHGRLAYLLTYKEAR